MANSVDVEALLLKAAAFESAAQFEDAYNTFTYVLSLEPTNDYAASRLPELKSRMMIADEGALYPPVQCARAANSLIAAKETLQSIEKDLEVRCHSAFHLFHVGERSSSLA